MQTQTYLLIVLCGRHLLAWASRLSPLPSLIRAHQSLWLPVTPSLVHARWGLWMPTPSLARRHGTRANYPKDPCSRAQASPRGEQVIKINAECLVLKLLREKNSVFLVPKHWSNGPRDTGSSLVATVGRRLRKDVVSEGEALMVGGAHALDGGPLLSRSQRSSMLPSYCGLLLLEIKTFLTVRNRK